MPLAGRTIVIDPGHNGIWTRRELRKVPSGNGRTKECNSSGTATNAGYPEHAYTWSQANALAAVLRARGATVRLTRPNDHGEGPCVNLRATLANELRADALVSIHADGSLAKGARGFHVIHSSTMSGGTAVEKQSLALAVEVRHALETETPMPRSTYIGHGTALNSRSDLGTLNLSRRPAVMIEMGNMRSATDAALLGSAGFRTTVAKALADAIESFVTR
jgi:N-acetylmuramoyl-L-alanine amidase